MKSDRDYLNWLLDSYLEKTGIRMYTYLCDILLNIPFMSDIEKEKQFVDNFSLYLHDIYLKETEHNYRKEPSVLEAFIFLSCHVVRMLHIPLTTHKIVDYMETIFNNLELVGKTENEVTEIIDHFLKRDYMHNLKYCAFPSDHDLETIKGVDLMYQSELWLKDVYNFV